MTQKALYSEDGFFLYLEYKSSMYIRHNNCDELNSTGGHLCYWDSAEENWICWYCLTHTPGKMKDLGLLCGIVFSHDISDVGDTSGEGLRK